MSKQIPLKAHLIQPGDQLVVIKTVTSVSLDENLAGHLIFDDGTTADLAPGDAMEFEVSDGRAAVVDAILGAGG